VVLVVVEAIEIGVQVVRPDLVVMSLVLNPPGIMDAHVMTLDILLVIVIASVIKVLRLLQESMIIQIILVEVHQMIDSQLMDLVIMAQLMMIIPSVVPHLLMLILHPVAVVEILLVLMVIPTVILVTCVNLSVILVTFKILVMHRIKIVVMALIQQQGLDRGQDPLTVVQLAVEHLATGLLLVVVAPSGIAALLVIPEDVAHYLLAEVHLVHEALHAVHTPHEVDILHLWLVHLLRYQGLDGIKDDVALSQLNK
jgi:hypothetical protein